MKKQILNEKEIERALRRISHEILERNNPIEDVVLVGIKTRGVYLADRLSQTIEAFENVKLPSLPLDIRDYRDDVPRTVRQMQEQQLLKDKKVIIVDDVLSTGRTVRAAMEAVLTYGRPKNIQLATLIDRGHRELPIRADYVGKSIPTSKKEDVQVLLREIDDEECVVIIGE